MTNSTVVLNRYRLRFSGLWLALFVTLFTGLPGWAQLACPQVQVNAVPNVVVCGGATTSPIVFSGTGTLYRWTNSNPAIGLADQGTNVIPAFTAVNFTGAPLIATITVTALGTNLCQGQSRVFTIRVNPQAQVNRPANQVVCVGSTTAPVNFTGTNNRATTYHWTNSNPGIGLPASGTGDIASFTALNTTGSVLTATITVTPEQPAFAYVANSYLKNVSVINTATNQVIATIGVGSGPEGVSVSGDGSRLYVANYESNNVSVINTATNRVETTIEGVGINPFGVIVSPDGSRVYVTNWFSKTVSVIDTATNKVIATILVDGNPYGISTSRDGNRLYVTNQYSANVSVINTVTNQVETIIKVNKEPTGVSVSPDGNWVYVANSGSDNVSVINTANNEVITTIGVGAHPISFGNFVGPNGCSGPAQTFTITVNPLPRVDNPGNQTVCAGSATQPINFTGSATAYTWTNSNPAIGLAASGTGNIASFTAVNATSTPQSATITVTPRGAADCTGQAQTFTITVDPATRVDRPANQAVCVGSATQPIVFTGTATTYAWTNANPAIGLGASGTGAIPAFTALNPTDSPQTATITVTAQGGCGTQSQTFTLTVNPLAQVDQPVSQTVCVGTTTAPVNFTGTNSRPTTYRWTNTNPGIGLATSGTDNIASFTALNTTASAQTATITVTPEQPALAYVANINSDNVSVINTATNEVIATVGVGSLPYGVSVSPDGSRVYVTNQASNNVSVINTATNEVATIGVGSLPYGVIVSPDGSRVYVANSGSKNVSVINTATSEVATIGVGIGPYGISVSPDGSRVYVTNQASNNVSVINTTTSEVTTIGVGNSPNSFGNFVGPAGCTGPAKTFTITVNPAPTDISLSQNTVAENQPAGTVVGSFSATDEGAGEDLTYSLVSTATYPDNNAFTIGTGANAGQLLTRAVLNYETKASYSIRVAITNACGLSYEKSFTITVTDVDDTPPAAPATPDLDSDSDSGVSSSDNITNVVSPIFSGTAEAGTTVRLFDTDGTTVLGSTTATSGGSWSITSASLSPGTHTVSAKATDGAGNVSAASTGLLIVIDTTPPTVSITTTATNPTSTSPIPLTAIFSESVTGLSLPAVSNGTASNLVTLSETVYTFRVTPTASGPVTVSIPANAAQDLAGNGNTVATPFSIQYNAPPQPPRITTQPVAGSSVCTGSSVTASVVVSSVTTVSYQWYKNDRSTPLAGQTSATLSLSGVQTGDAGSYSVVVSSAGGSVTSTAYVLTVNALPVASLSNNGPLSCTLTSVTLTASGGGTGETFSYRFSTGATPLTGGNTASVSSLGLYSVTVVSSSGCSATASTTVGSDQTAPTASITASTTLLTDATPATTLTGSGGASTQPFGFTWSTGQTTAIISVSVAGTYSLTVTGVNGCLSTASITISRQTPVASFSCASGVAYQVAGTPTGNSTLYRYDVNTGARTTIAPLPVKANAIGFDADNRLWGYDINNQRVIQIGPTGQVNAFAIAHLPASGFNVGELLPGGYLVLYVSNATRYYVVDVNPTHPTYLQLVDPANNYVLQTGPSYGSPLSTAVNINDFAYNSGTNRLVALTNPSAGSNAFKLVVINPATGSVSYGPTLTGTDIRSETGGYGGQFIGATGSLCVFANELGKFYRIDLVSGAATLLSSSTPAGNNDGASCPTAVLSYLVSGTVFTDTNGLDDNQLNGTGTNVNGTLRAILYDNTTGQVGAITPVNADGTFSLGATPDHDYTLYLSSLSATVGQSAVPTLGLPGSWTFVGEQLGSGAGSDGTPDGVLVLGLVNAPVTSANFGLQLLPDLTLVLYARPSTVYGNKPISLVVDVLEVGGVDSRGLITVRLTKDAGMSLVFDPTTRSVNNRPVQNGEWNMDATSDENYYILTSRRVIAAGEQLSIGLTGSLRAGATSGVVTVSGVLAGGSGGETKVTNNTDAEKIDYFQQ